MNTNLSDSQYSKRLVLTMQKRYLHNTILSFGLLTLTFVLTACETTVQIELPEHKSVLVASSIFAPDSSWQVHLTNSTSFTSNDQIREVRNADVEIWQGEQKLHTLTEDPENPGRYNSPATAIQGEAYTLKITAQGYAPISATSSTPSMPQFNLSNTSINSSDDGVTKINVSINVTDRPNIKDYYALSVMVAEPYEDFDTGEIRLSPPYRVSFNTKDPIFETTEFLGDAEGVFLDVGLFNDTAFPGQSKSIKINLDSFSFDSSFDSIFYIHLLSLTEELYQHWLSINQQIEVDGNPFAEPVQVLSNIEDGLGIFAGYTPHVVTLKKSDIN